MKPPSIVKTQSGYSAVEMVIALAITTLVVASATSGWLYCVRGERMNSTQTELDIAVRNSMENLKHDLRLSSLDKMFFYPPGPGPYTAISFPMAEDTNNDGLVEMIGGTNILWTSTVIYHVWTGTPNELRKTVFHPRDNTLTPAQLQNQLGSVVTNGTGSQTYGSANATTRAIFKNLFTWSIWGKSATFDGYSTIIERDTDVSYGSLLLDTGVHQVKFNVIGKNNASSGYKIGIDTLTASACGVEREGEAQLPVASQAGATAAAEYMTLGSWSGNYQLSFPAASTGSYFTLNIDNDRWEETNFRGQGALCTRTLVGFDPTLSPKDYIVQLIGSPGYPWGSPTDPYAWTAENQTGTTPPTSDTNNTLSKCVVRVLLRGGSQAQNNGAIRFSGHWPYVNFQASTYGSLRIIAAYIAEAADHTNYTMNAATAGTQLFFYPSGNASQTIAAGGNAFMIPQSPFDTDTSKSYLVTFLTDDDKGYAMSWNETHPGAPGCYIIPGTNSPTAADAQAANWSAKPVTTSDNVYGLYGLYTTYPTNGLFTSQIFDTKIDSPGYSTVSWNATCPAGTLVRVKVRTATNPDMSDAPAWSNITAFISSPASISSYGNNRYVQFLAILDPDSGGWNSPKLRDVTIKWTGATKVVDVAAIMSKGPNYGICEVTVDGKPLAKGLRIDLSIFADIAGWNSGSNRITSTMTSEIEPRNTGK